MTPADQRTDADCRVMRAGGAMRGMWGRSVVRVEGDTARARLLEWMGARVRQWRVTVYVADGVVGAITEHTTRAAAWEHLTATEEVPRAA